MDTYTVDLESMGKRIRELRNTQNKTQEVFADMIDTYFIVLSRTD